MSPFALYVVAVLSSPLAEKMIISVFVMEEPQPQPAKDWSGMLARTTNFSVSVSYHPVTDESVPVKLVRQDVSVLGLGSVGVSCTSVVFSGSVGVVYVGVGDVGVQVPSEPM